MSPKYGRTVSVLAWLFLSSIFASGQPEAPETIEFLTKIERPWQQVSRIEILYEAYPEPDNSSGRPVQKRIVIAMPDKFYQSAAHLGANRNWEDDPFAQSLVISDGRAHHKWTFDRIYSTWKMTEFDSLPGTTWQDDIWPLLPVWPLRAYTMPDRIESHEPVILAKALHSLNSRIIGKETLNGEPCAIFAVGDTDRYWVCSDRPLCVMKYESLRSDTHQLRQSIVTESLMNVANGMTFPQVCRIETWDPNKREIVKAGTLMVLRFRINSDASDEVFRAALPPGSALQTSEGVRQTVPGGIDLLDRVAEFTKTYAAGSLHLRTVLAPLIVGIGIGGAIASFRMISRSRKTLTPNR